MSDVFTKDHFGSAISIHRELTAKAEKCRAYRLCCLRELIESQQKRLLEAKKQVAELPECIAKWGSEIAELEAVTAEELLDKIAELARVSAG